MFGFLSLAKRSKLGLQEPLAKLFHSLGVWKASNIAITLLSVAVIGLVPVSKCSAHQHYFLSKMQANFPSWSSRLTGFLLICWWWKSSWLRGFRFAPASVCQLKYFAQWGLLCCELKLWWFECSGCWRWDLYWSWTQSWVGARGGACTGAGVVEFSDSALKTNMLCSKVASLLKISSTVILILSW